VNLQWKDDGDIISNKYLLSFVANIPALGLVKYQIKKDENAMSSLAKTTIYNSEHSFQKYVSCY